jgi:hypothetical protein
MIDELVAQSLIEKAQPRANRINDVLNESDDLRELPDRQMAIASLLFAVGMAKLTKLDLEDFVGLAAYAYVHVSPDKEKAGHA